MSKDMIESLSIILLNRINGPLHKKTMSTQTRWALALQLFHVDEDADYVVFFFLVGGWKMKDGKVERKSQADRQRGFID